MKGMWEDSHEHKKYSSMTGMNEKVKRKEGKANRMGREDRTGDNHRYYYFENQIHVYIDPSFSPDVTLSSHTVTY